MINKQQGKPVLGLCEDFKRELDRTKKYTKPFAASMWEIMKNEKVTYVSPNGTLISTIVRDGNHFSEITGLGPSTYNRIKSCADDYVPSLRTFITLCVVYQLNMTMVTELRRSFGYDFNAKDRTHQAYIYLLVNCRGKSISYCNKVLAAFGIEKKYFLGDGTIDD